MGEIWDEYEQKGLAPPSKTIVSASSVCEARSKLDEFVYNDLNHGIITAFEKENDEYEWKGHRVFGIDGCRVNLPLELMENGYKPWNKKLHHYPHGLISSLYRLSTGIVYDFVMTNKYNEREHALDHLRIINENDIIVCDRGYFSYLLLYQCIENGAHLLFRIGKHIGNKKILDFISSDRTDEIIEYTPALGTTYDIKRQGYDLDFRPIKLRLLKWTIHDTEYICATTLLDPPYTVQSLSDLYHSRWGIEELYKISKLWLRLKIFIPKQKEELSKRYTLILY